MEGIRYNPEGFEDFTNFCNRKFKKDPADMTDEEFSYYEDLWLCEGLKG